MKIKQYKIQIEQAVLDDLQKRLKRTRWTDQEESIGWEQGTNLKYLKGLTQYWIQKYDWSKEEEKLNAFSWFDADIDGKSVKFIYEKGKGKNPTPLILFHGWPDSVMRFLRLIPMLTDPEKYGGHPDESFDVVIPSFIGGFSDKRETPSTSEIKDIAETGWKLMTEGLGYKTFAAGGGDGGSPISQIIAVDHPESITALYLNDVGWHTNMMDRSNLSEGELQYLQSIEYSGYREGAYAMVQGTKPQTLGMVLNDSPVGMAAWIVEKFKTWSDCDGDIEKRYSKDEILTNIMLYWYKNSVRSFSYKEEFVSPSIRPDQQVNAPVALALSPNDVNPIPPREFAERILTNIRRWKVMSNGGHFLAMEFPELMARDMREFFKSQKIA